MKLSESLAAVGQSFPYYPKLCPVVGGVKACVFLCIVFWKAFEEHDGWLQMSMTEIMKLSGLSVKEQRHARATLKSIGVLQEREDRLAHQMFYRIDAEALDAAFEGHGISGSAEVESPEVPKGHSPECPNGTSTIRKRPRQDPDKTIRSGGNPVTFWNEQERLPKVKCLSGGRLAKLNQRLRDTFWSENFKSAVSKILASDFCMGKNERGWLADFDWMLQPDTVAKIMEGKYDNRNGNYTHRNGSHQDHNANTLNAGKGSQYRGVGRVSAVPDVPGAAACEPADVERIVYH